LLNLIPEGVYRELLIDRLAGEIGLNPDRLAQLIEDPSVPVQLQRRPLAKQRPTAKLAGDAPGNRSVYVRQAIRLILHKPAATKKIVLPEGFDGLSNPGISLLREMLIAAGNEPGMKPARLAENFASHSDGGAALNTLLTQELHLDDDANWSAQLQDTVNAILRDALERRQDALIARMDTPDGLSAAEKAEFLALPERLSELWPGTD
jgi:DNA primase